MLKIMTVPNKQALVEFSEFVFAQADAKNLDEFSDNLIDAHDKGTNLTAEVQDKILQTNQFAKLVNHPMWKEMAADVFQCKKNDILIAFPHLRIDLPNYFKDDQLKMSLPWHQEAGYYLQKGDCCPGSVVLSTYIHDCDQSGGALQVASETETSVLDHDNRYMDPNSKKFLRVEVPCPEVTEFVETSFGETAVFDFLLRHRSGINSRDTVRITFLLRASRRKDVEDYIQQIAS
ncbi:MAG: phytanoyl-CoA dioxygenase family protein [Roseibium sp.]